MYTRRKFLRNTAGLTAFAILAPWATMARAGGSLNFFNWSDYIGEENIPDFEDVTGIKVNESFFGSVDELFSKVRGGGSGYDVVCPSQGMMVRMYKGGLLANLDKNLLPNLKNLSPAWQGLSFDPTNKFHVPYLWGTTGIGYSKKAVKGTDMADMKWVLDSDKFSGRIAWLDSAVEMSEIAGYYLEGRYVDTYDKAMLKEVENLLMKQKKYVKVFAADNGQDLLMSGDVDVAIEYSGDIGQIAVEDDDMAYALPLNGGFRWVDSLCVLKDAPNYENAHKFMNFMLDAKQGAMLAEYTEYATPNAAAIAVASEQYRNDPVRFPSDDLVAKLPFSTSRSEQYYNHVDEMWTRIKAS